MSSGSDNHDISEKTNVFTANTKPIKVEADYRVPPCLVLLVGPPEKMGKQWVIDRPTMLIGRSLEADIQLGEASLSKNHARIELSKTSVTITDLGSTNKTLIDGKKLIPNQAQALKNNDQIQCGSLVFKFLERGILSETTEKARMQSELEDARHVQESLFPKNKEATYQWVQIGGQYRSASECGGDWWWHWTCADKAFALIGDATGHGAAAALITSAARSAIAAIEDNAAIGIEKVYTTLSHALQKCSGGKVTMSAFLVEVHLTTRKLRYINASHLPAVLLPSETAGLSWKTLHYLMGSSSAPLGAVAKKLVLTELTVAPKTRLVLLTDGLTERLDQDGNMLNERGFNKMLLQAHTDHPHVQQEFLDQLLQQSDQLAQSAPLADDITVVALDFN
jgi:serine phosphatase RsbU (regulator of sigma subunit)